MIATKIRTPVSPEAMVQSTGEIMTDKDAEARQIVLPLYEEAVTVSRRVVPKNRARVSTVTHQRQQLVDELLQHENIEIDRISIGRPIEAIPAVREEDDTIIVPVVEEVLTVQRTLILKEEVRIRKVRTDERYQESVTLRRQDAGITRLPVEDYAAAQPGQAAGAGREDADPPLRNAKT